MLIYFIVLLILIVPLFIYRGDQSSPLYNKYYWFECFVLILLMGLRYRVGGDSIRYEAYFLAHPTFAEYLQDKSWLDNQGFQPFWTIFQAICKSITDDFIIVQLLHSMFVNGIVFYFANRYVKARFTFIVLYYFLLYPYFSSEIMRESIAVSIFLLSYQYLVTKRYLKYFIFCFLAFMFHASASIMISLPFIYPILSKIRGIKSLLFVFLIAFLISHFTVDLLGVLLDIFFSGNSLLETKADGILASKGLNIFGIINKLIEMFPVFLVLYYVNKSKASYIISQQQFIVLIYLILNIIGMIYLPLNRLQNYFSILFLVVFVDFLTRKEYKLNNIWMMKIALMIMLAFKFLYYLSPLAGLTYFKDFRNYEFYVPYHSVFDKEKELRRERSVNYQF